MIPPHVVRDQGRVVILDDGPLHIEDIRDLLAHTRIQHHRHPTEVIYVNDDQARWIYDWQEQVAMYTDPLNQRHPGLNQRHPGLIGYLYGVGIARLAYLRPPPVAYWHTTAAGAPPQTTPYWTTVTNGTLQAQTFYDTAAWKAQFGTDILGKKLEGVWFDEPKKKPLTTHEVW